MEYNIPLPSRHFKMKNKMMQLTQLKHNHMGLMQKERSNVDQLVRDNKQKH